MDYILPASRARCTWLLLYLLRLRFPAIPSATRSAENALTACARKPLAHQPLWNPLTVKKKSVAAAASLLNQLHREDAVDFVRKLAPESVDMLLTDPPYCSGGLHSAARKQATGVKYINASTKTEYEDFDFDNMDQRSWLYWCQGWLRGAHEALKTGGLVVCFIDWRQLPALTDVVQAAGFTLRGIAVWDKTIGRARPRRGGFKQQAEFIVWASKGAMGDREVYLPGVFQSRLAFPKKHLTEKPIEVAREIVRLVPEGGTVLDLFAGSGTFLIAAKEAGLNWVGCELGKRNHEIASERLAAAEPQLLAA